MITNDYNINFNGLGRQFKKKLYSSDAIATLDNLYPHSFGVVGNIPHVWVKNMPINLRKENIINLYKELGALIKFTDNGNEYKFLKYKDYYAKINKEFTLKLNNILHKNKVLPDTQNVIWKYVNEGSFGVGYLIKNTYTGDCLFVKKFNRVSDKLDFLGQGVNHEANVNLFVRHNLKSQSDIKHFPKFYYADLKNGYYVEEYLSNNNTIAKSRLTDEQIKYCNNIIQTALKKIGLRTTDTLHSNYKVYCRNEDLFPVFFDFGGVIN